MTKKNKKSSVQNKIRTLDFYIYRIYYFICSKEKGWFIVFDEYPEVLSVKNTYIQPIIYEKGEIRTSKVNAPDEHGVGIKNILKIVEKYDGSYVMDNGDDEFYISIIFMI